MTAKHIIKVPFTVDRDIIGPLKDWWVEKRFVFFRDYTLKSILNQTFQNFDIWMLCGLWKKQLTDKFPWHERVKLIYDNGREELKNIDTDYLAVTRIDSDDLIHKDAMAEIAGIVKDLKITGKGFLIFKDNLCWNMNEGNKFIGKHVRQHPPFFTDVYPKSIYKRWKKFITMTNHPHGTAHLDADYYRELSINKICVVKHDANNSNVKRGRKPKILTESEWKKNLKRGHVISKDPAVIREYLRDFGVDYEG